MAQQTINAIDTLNQGRVKINDNFTDLYGRLIYVEDFGAVGDGVTNDQPAIQAAIDYCITNNIKRLHFRAKTYLIASPLFLYKLNAGAYAFFNLDLVGAVNANAGLTGQSTKIKCSHTNTFAIGLQTARSCTIENLLIEGGRVDGSKSSYQIATFDVTQWAVPGVRDEVYSPYCGIVIDPFGTSVPIDGGYPGMSSYYKASAAGSSGVSIRNCYIYYFVVNVMISPSGTTSNAESINVYNCRLYNSKVAWAAGQSQTRNCRLVDSAIYYALNGIDTTTYGVGTGSCCVVDSLVVANVRNIIVSSTSRQALDIRSIYAENFWKIGVISGSKMVTFSGCTFKFNYGEDNIPGPDTFIGGNTIVHFEGCDFFKQFGDISFNMSFRNTSRVSFNNCDLSCLNIPITDLATNILNIENSSVFGYECLKSSSFVGATPEAFYNYHGIRVRKNSLSLSYAVYHNVEPNGNSFRFLNTATLTVSGSEATFTATNPEYIKVGDLIFGGSVAGVYFLDQTNNNSTTATADLSPYLGTVKTIVGTTITIKDVRFNITTGSYDIYSQWSNRYYGAMFGTLTSGSNVITNVYKESSGSLVGQRIQTADPSQMAIGLYVVSEDVGARTLTLSGNVSSSVSSVALYTAYYTGDIIVASAPSSITGLYVEKGNIIRTRGQTLTDKAYFVSTGGIVGNGTHTPVFKELNMT